MPLVIRSPSFFIVALFLTASSNGIAATFEPIPVEKPVVDDPNLELSIVAAEPDIVTPVGVAVDSSGRVLAVESNTHFRPMDYRGPATDRVLGFMDRDGDGRYETRGVFASDFKFAMNLSIGTDGSVYVVERSKITRLRDKDRDGVADERSVVVQLETKANYPHNGLDSFTLTPDGYAFIGTGENLGDAYTLHGSDGRTWKAKGDGGQIFRVRADGSELTLWATGFWNAFAQTQLPDGSLLSIDNDPETRPPNRLIHVVRGADYGFQYRYGRAADHPFVAWNGEVPGTLPRIGGVGEGSTGILSTSATGFPSSYASSVLVSSWSDRRIELHTLTPKGASFSSKMRVLVQGGRSFRPVAMAAGPDGSVFFTDWVVRDYSVHGHGRLWRLKARNHKPGQSIVHPGGPAPTAARTRLLQLEKSADLTAMPAEAGAADPFLRTAAVRALAQAKTRALLANMHRARDVRMRLTGLQSLRLAFRTAVHSGAPEESVATAREALQVALSAGLADPSEDVRIFAIITAAEGLRDDLKLRDTEIALLHASVKRATPAARLAQIYRAATAMLKIEPIAAMVLPGRAADLATLQSRHPVQARRDALWRLAAILDDALLTVANTIALSAHEPSALRADAVAVLANGNRVANLVALLDDRDRTLQVEAARALRAGLGEPAVEAAVRKKLAVLATGRDAGLREELRFALSDDSVAAETRPTDMQGWWQAVRTGGNPDAGRRVFMNPGVGCYRCHRVAGLGVDLGPPLTFIGEERAERLMESLFDPNVDVVWSVRTFEMKDGQSHVGMVKERADDGSILLTNTVGQRMNLPGKSIVKEEKGDASLMPDGLLETTTVQGVRDLFAFLRTLK